MEIVSCPSSKQSLTLWRVKILVESELNHINQEPILKEPFLNSNEFKIFNRESLKTDDAQNGSKLVGISSPQDKQGTGGEPAILGTEKNAGWDFYVWVSLLHFHFYVCLE